MMAQNPGVAKEGGVKHYMECVGLYVVVKELVLVSLDWVLVSELAGKPSCFSIVIRKSVKSVNPHKFGMPGIIRMKRITRING